MIVEPTKNFMEKQTDILETADIQAMLRVLPNEAGAICLEDLKEIFADGL
jgi:hypothetical protein